MIVAWMVTTVLLIVLGIFQIKAFLNKYDVGIYYINKEDELAQEEADAKNPFVPVQNENAIDLRGTPTHQCVCGCNIWNLKVIFEDFEIATYFIDMECANCGSLATAPKPVDKEARE